MTTFHDDLELQAGDSWDISLFLKGIDGLPQDLSEAVVNWILVSPDGEDITPETVIVTITDAASGAISISIPASSTAALVGGRYMDSVRIYQDGKSTTLRVGFIEVTSDPYRLIEA